jgi:hypothetical protein
LKEQEDGRKKKENRGADVFCLVTIEASNFYFRVDISCGRDSLTLCRLSCEYEYFLTIHYTQHLRKPLQLQE